MISPTTLQAFNGAVAPARRQPIEPAQARAEQPGQPPRLPEQRPGIAPPRGSLLNLRI